MRAVKEKDRTGMVGKVLWVKPFMIPPIESGYTCAPNPVSTVPVPGWWKVEVVGFENPQSADERGKDE